MKYCSHCGKEIVEDAVVCVHCGCAIEGVKKKDEDKKSPLWFLLGFFIPIVGLILYCVWKDEYPLRAKSVGKGALISALISVGLVVSFYLISFLVVCYFIK